MKLTKNNLIKKLGITDKETIKVVVDYNKKLPILTEDGTGFSVNARELYEQLGSKREFSKWIKERIDKYDFQKNIDYITNWYKDNKIIDEGKNADVKLDVNNTNQMVRNGYSKEYFITLDMAKQLAMVQNNEQGKIARKYFIKVEKILLEAVKWDKVRKPERENYKTMCSELKNYLMRNFEKEPKFYDYSNEADAINKICLGATAKQIREYIEAQDENTREWLTAKQNEYIDFIQNLNTMYLRMNLNKDVRYNLIQQGFKAMYPNASFLIVNKEIIDSKFKI